MKNNYGIIIEARTGSKRFPSKILKKINNKTILELLIDRLITKIPKKKILVATTKKAEDTLIIKICKKKKIDFFLGSENNLINRIYSAAKLKKIDNIIQITADNPLVNLDIMQNLIKIYFKKKLVFATNSFHRTFPIGSDIRIFKRSILESNENKVPIKKREHTAFFFLKNFNKIKSFNLYAPKELNRPDIRLTLDYPEDFVVLKKIYFKFKKNKYFNLKKIIKFLDENPKIKKINSKHEKHFKIN